MTARVIGVPVFTFLFRGNISATAVPFVYFLTNQGPWCDFAESGSQSGFVWFLKEPVFGGFCYFFFIWSLYHFSLIPAGGSSIGWLSPKFSSFCLNCALLSSIMMVFVSSLKRSIPRFRISRGKRFQYFWTLRPNVCYAKE